MNVRRGLVWAARISVSLLFIVSGGLKILDPVEFARAVAGYDVLPEIWVLPVSFWIPWLEVWCGLALAWVGFLRDSARLLILLMLTGFTILKVSAVLRGLDISCGCTGSDAPLGWESVWGNVFWILILLSGFLAELRIPNRKSSES